jgi:hypothetical protein
MSGRGFAGRLATVVAVVAALVFAPLQATQAAPPGDPCAGKTGRDLVICRATDTAKTVARYTPAGIAATKAAGAAAAMERFTPSNIIEEWAKSLGRASAAYLEAIHKASVKVSTPAYATKWWREQYAVTFGLSLLLLAFVLVVVAAKIGGPAGSVSQVQLLRQAGWRVGVLVPALAIVPGALYLLWDLSATLSGVFAKEAAGSAGDAVTAYSKTLAEIQGFDGIIGGVITVLVLGGIIALLALVVFAEMAAVSFGLSLAGLLVPLVVAMSVYPPWRRPLARVLGLVGGLMLTPPILYAVFWALWSALGGLSAGEGGLLPLMLFLLVGTFFAAAVPFALAWLMPMLAPSAEGGSALRQPMTAAMTRAGLGLGAGARLSHLMQTRGTAEPAAAGGYGGVPGQGRPAPDDPYAPPAGAGRPGKGQGARDTAGTAGTPGPAGSGAAGAGAGAAAGGPAGAAAGAAADGARAAKDDAQQRFTDPLRRAAGQATDTGGGQNTGPGPAAGDPGQRMGEKARRPDDGSGR